MTQDAHLPIAVVDDDSAVLESMMDLLESAGFPTLTFSSAKDFLAGGALQCVGCLVSDICMPEIDGWELRSLANERRPELPVILITAHEEIEGGMRALSSDGRQFLFRKSFDSHKLLGTIRAAMSGKAFAT